MSDSPRSVAAALGSSFLGFPTHLGFLQSLCQEGWAPHGISGSSSGAIVAGLYAAGMELEEMETCFTHPRLKSSFLEWTMLPRAIGTLIGWRGCPAIFTGTGLAKLLHSLLGTRRIEDCTHAKLHLAVTNLRTSKVEIRTTGPLVETILASCALPGIIAPRWLGGELLWDGGLGSSVPIEPFLIDSPATHIAAHSIIHQPQLTAREKSHHYSFTGAILAGHQLTADELLHWKSVLARQQGRTITCVETITTRPRLGLPLTLPPTQPWPTHARSLIALGRLSGQQAAANLSHPDLASQPLEPPR